MNIPQAIDALKTNTENFLRTNQLKIVGSGRTPAFDGPANFKMETYWKGGFTATFVSQIAPLGVDEFQAWYIPMQQLQGFTANWLPGPVDTPLRLLLTSQFSGCLFGVGSNGARTCVAHIQPDQTTHKDKGLKDSEIVAARQKDLRTSAMQANLTPFVSQGVTHGELEYATVVGNMDESGQWKFFSQNIDSMPNTITGMNFI